MSKPLIYKWNGEWRVLVRGDKVTGFQIFGETWKDAWEQYQIVLQNHKMIT